MTKSKLRCILESDYNTLLSEYNSESECRDKIYKQMYEKYIDFEIREKIDNDNFSNYHLETHSERFCNGKYEISIVIDRYSKTKSYFYSLLDLQDIGIELRKDSAFRIFTKFAMYLEDIIPPM